MNAVEHDTSIASREAIAFACGQKVISKLEEHLSVSEDTAYYRLLFAYDFFSGFDKNSLIIYLHLLHKIKPEITQLVTSLSENQIAFTANRIAHELEVASESYDYSLLKDRLTFFQVFIQDLLSDCSEYELTNRYNESLVMIKIMRKRAKQLLRE